jgi:hypothetical protein
MEKGSEGQGKAKEEEGEGKGRERRVWQVWRRRVWVVEMERAETTTSRKNG